VETYEEGDLGIYKIEVMGRLQDGQSSTVMFEILIKEDDPSYQMDAPTNRYGPTFKS